MTQQWLEVEFLVDHHDCEVGDRRILPRAVALDFIHAGVVKIAGRRKPEGWKDHTKRETRT